MLTIADIPTSVPDADPLPADRRHRLRRLTTCRAAAPVISAASIVMWLIFHHGAPSGLGSLWNRSELTTSSRRCR